nr:FCD domain-containing protein [Pseudonocardia sp. HH130630-07]
MRSAAVVRRLGSAIALGILVDGEQLPAEAQLAASFNVSTVTLRDALSDLRSRGLVRTRRGRGGGSFVRAAQDALTELSRGRLREISSTDLRELGDLRGAVSGTAARLAAERATGAEIGRLGETLDRLARAEGGTARRRIESRYLIDVAAAAQSVRLTMQEIEVQFELGQVLWGAGPAEADPAATVQGHRRVVEAIARRDGGLARALTEEHVAVVTARLVDAHVRLTRRPAVTGGHDDGYPEAAGS